MMRHLLLARPKQLQLWQLRHAHFATSVLARTSSAIDCTTPALAENDYWHKASRWLLPIFLGLGTASLLSESTRCDADKNKDVLINTRVQIMNVWSECNNDLQELEYSSPWLSLGRLLSPDVNEVGDKICIKIWPTQYAQPRGLSNYLQKLLQGDEQTPSLRITSSTRESGDAYQEDVQIGEQLQITSMIPGPESSERPSIEFIVDAAVGLSQRDLQVIISIMRKAANYTKIPTARGTHYLFSGSLSSWEDGLLSLDHSMDSAVRAIEGFLGDSVFPTLEREFQRGINEVAGALKQLGLHSFEEFSRDGGLFSGLNKLQSTTEGHDSLRDMEALQEKEKKAGSPNLGSKEANRAVKELEKLGAIVYCPTEKTEVDWGSLAGYEEQKELMEEILMMPLLHPEVYDDISSRTRQSQGGTRPRAVIFEGPPGCGKTSSARVLATQAAATLVYIPVEKLFSKWYGESEKNFSNLFKWAEKLDKCFIFLDEIDSLATTRGSDMHEGTRRVLGVLLRQMDGFESKRSIIIGATNRKQDLDPALRSRFDASIYFQLPDLACRKKILAKYAQQLADKDLAALALACPDMSGRDLRDVCESAERRVATKIVKGVLEKGSLPGLADYVHASKALQAHKQGERQVA